MVYTMVRVKDRPTVEIGTQWILDTVGSGTWEVPATGKYEIEMHGGGGEGYSYTHPLGFTHCLGGGGSGELYTKTLTKGDSISFSVGKANGPHTAPNSSRTTFGDLVITAGENAGDSGVGLGSGSLATNGDSGFGTFAAGGLGNKNKPDQTYGNGGGSSPNYGQSTPPENGGIIITYLGQE